MAQQGRKALKGHLELRAMSEKLVLKERPDQQGLLE
jgi:hypothetical protein